MATNSNPEPTAAGTYTKRADDIARLIDAMQMHLEEHADNAKADPKNWGWAGDLGHVRAELIKLVAFLDNTDTETVEDFLEDGE